MTTQHIINMIVGFMLLVASPILWKKYSVDGFLAVVIAFIGLTLVATGQF